MTRKHTLGAHERLKSRKAISALFKSGKKLSVQPVLIYYSISAIANQSPVSIGAGASTRYFKKAVDRNRIKRVIRENYRTQNESLKTLLNNKQLHLDIFFLFTGKDLALLTELPAKMNVILKQLETVIDP